MKIMSGFRWVLKWQTSAVLSAILAFLVAPVGAQATHTQGGSVAYGAFGVAECLGLSPNCTVWWISGCSDAVANAPGFRENGVHSSIANVVDVAGTTRTITITAQFGGVNTGAAGAAVQFFTAGCAQRKPSPALPNPIKPGQSVTFTVPIGVKWMTVTGGGQVVGLRWRMT